MAKTIMIVDDSVSVRRVMENLVHSQGWLPLVAKDGLDAIELLQRAFSEKISLTPGMLFSATRKFRNFIRINCGHPWDARIEHAVERIGGLVRELLPSG